MEGPSSNPRRKRKRAASDAVINPLSHSPDTLRQFAVAGYPAEQPLPSKAYPGFPHRPANYQSRHPPSDADANADADIDTATEASDAAAAGWQTTTTDDGDDETATDTNHHHSASPRPSHSHRRLGKPKKQDRIARAYRARTGCLVAAVQRCLAEGDVARARRAFGLLARARVNGRRVDLRFGRAWEMGAEVLLREGEEEEKRPVPGEEGKEEKEEEEEEEEEEERRLARAEERLERLRAYYRFLIQQYPFNKAHPATTAEGVLDFQAALFGAEMEAAHASHRRGLARLRRSREVDDDDGGMDVDEPAADYGYEPGGGWDGGDEAPQRADHHHDHHHHLRGLSHRALRAREREDELRLAALQRMTDVAQRMDTVMETPPFSRDPELLRLRAMAALYLGDLEVPPAPRSDAEDSEGRRARAEQRRTARRLLLRIKEGGGELKDHDEALLESLRSDDEEDEADEEDRETSPLPMFSSMGGA
ncbi:c188f08d-e7c1-45c3-868b-a35cfad8c8e1 [Thermothielavioides terrestris]|uniref:C188f08d-e7c1-45c3-868b-a35cfad8c8e1 n=1 Tax=Thermothielavioides terrestris TaxID=2587410 RepID=A0A3S4AQX6_9PEZI|nr:c188f08d-e7c1-45c3-868b-a35cfad8c8e1 [Thermothielavioides terrestris]